MLDRKAALTLTEKIKQNTKDYARLVYQAWEGKVWVALGYENFGEWLSKELSVSLSRGYQLLNIVVLEDKVKTLGVFPDNFTISDYATRLIVKHGVDDFLTRLGAVITDDPNRNEEHFLTLFQEVRTGKPAPKTAPEPPHDFTYAAEAATQAFRLHCQHLPTVEQVDDPALLPVVRGKLRDAVALAEARLAEYATALTATEERQAV